MGVGRAALAHVFNLILSFIRVCLTLYLSSFSFFLALFLITFFTFLRRRLAQYFVSISYCLISVIYYALLIST